MRLIKYMYLPIDIFRIAADAIEILIKLNYLSSSSRKNVIYLPDLEYHSGPTLHGFMFDRMTKCGYDHNHHTSIS